MIDYWSVVVGCSRSKVKGLNPLQIYNIKQALSTILTIIFLHIFCKNPQRSQIHRFTCSQGRGKIVRFRKGVKTDRTDKTDKTIRIFVRDRLNRLKVLIVLRS